MRSIVRLLDDVADAPDRYAMLGRILFVEMATWSKDEKDLANIRRLMDNSERRLDHARGGKTRSRSDVVPNMRKLPLGAAAGSVSASCRVSRERAQRLDGIVDE